MTRASDGKAGKMHYHDDEAVPAPSGSIPDEPPTALVEYVRRYWPSKESVGGSSISLPAESPATGEGLLPEIDHFQIVRELGRGGFGVVYLARDLRLDRDVALKVLQPAARHTPDSVQRFLREPRAIATLDHPNINPVYGAGTWAGGLYISLHYCCGGSLADWIRNQQSPVAPRRAAQLIRSLALAVQHAHDRGVLHRDLKPANVLLDRGPQIADLGMSVDNLDEYVPRLTDFGLAKLLANSEDQTQTGAVVGTIKYMSPEQSGGHCRDSGPQTDVYALGVILYELLVGRPPFVGESALETVRQIQCDEPLPIRKLQPRVSRDLETICGRCLEKDPRHRYPTAGELADELDRYLNHQAIRAHPPGPLRRTSLWIRRHPNRAAALAVATAAMIGLPAGLFWHAVGLQRAFDETQREHAHSVAAQAAADQSARAAGESARIARENEARVLQNVYLGDMRLAQQFRQQGDLAAMSSLLDRHASANAEGGPDVMDVTSSPQRGFEWSYLNRFRDALVRTLPAQTGEVDLLTFAADGKILATSGISDGELHLWGIPDGRRLVSFPVRKQPQRRWEEEAAAISADGQRAATLIDFRTMVVWDVARGAELIRCRHETTVLTLAFSPDGNQVAVGGEKETRVWDCASGQAVCVIPHSARLLAFHPHGGQLALVEAHPAANVLHVWDPARNVSLWNVPSTMIMRQILYSPDGRMLTCLLKYPSGSFVNVFHADTSAPLFNVAQPGSEINRLAFVTDSHRLMLMLADGSSQFYEVRTGQTSGPLRGPAMRLTRGANSLDNRWLATAGTGGRVLLWDQRLLDECDELLPENEVVGPVVYSPDGGLLAVATRDYGALVVDAASCKVNVRLPRQRERIADFAFSPDGTRLVMTDAQTVSCWSRRDRASTWSVPMHGRGISCLAWSPDGGLVAFGGLDCLVHLCRTDDGVEVGALKGHTGAITALHFLGRSGLLTSAGLDGVLRLWDVQTHALVGEPFDAKGPIEQVAVSGDGRKLVTGRQGGTLSVWELNDDSHPERLLMELRWTSAFLSAFSLSADGQTLARGGGDGTLEAFDLASTRTTYKLSGRRVGGRSIAYSPSGRAVATVSPETCLTLWDLDTWQTRTLGGTSMSAVRSLAFSSDGAKLAVGVDDGVPPDHPSTEDLPAPPNARRFSVPKPPQSWVSNHLISSDGIPWNAGGPGFRLWDVATRRERPAPDQWPTLTSVPLLAWSSQGMIAAGSHDGTVWVWDANANKLITRFAANPQNADVMAWQPQTGQPPLERKIIQRLDGITALSFSFDGSRLAVATERGTVQWIDSANWNQRSALHTVAGEVTALAFSPSGSLLVAAFRRQLKCWALGDAETSALYELGDPSDSPICSVAFSHDGDTLALGRRDATVQLLDCKRLSGQARGGAHETPTRVLLGHLDRVVAVAFSPDDRTLATGSWDSTVRLWHAASGQEVATLKAHQGKVNAVAFSPDGTLLATGGQRDADHGDVFLWRATPNADSIGRDVVEGTLNPQ